MNAHDMTLADLIEQAKTIRQGYHRLEEKHHGTPWSVEEDALAFLTDAALVGRLTMARQQRWPASDTESQLEHKLAECVWWLAVLADRMEIDLPAALQQFLEGTAHKVVK